MFDGKTHYFDWAIFNSYVKLPEGIIIVMIIFFITQYTYDILYDAICIYCTILYHIHTYVHHYNYCQYLIWDIIISLPAL